MVNYTYHTLLAFILKFCSAIIYTVFAIAAAPKAFAPKAFLSHKPPL